MNAATANLIRRTLPTFLWTILPVVWSAAAAPPPFTFEGGPDTWKPRAPSVVVARIEHAGPQPDSQACLRVQGPVEGGWNYAATDRFPVEPGRLYRLSAWVRVDQLGPNSPAPFLKCEFVGPDPKSPPGQIQTSHYDTAQLGQWQELSAEFKTPDNARQAWLALEKGTSQPTKVNALLDDIDLRPIARLSVLDQYRLTPPSALERVRGRHPRLYLNAQTASALRDAIGTNTPYQAIWKELQSLADRAVKRGPPAYRDRDSYSGDEQLWQREVGNTMPGLAMAWLMTRDPRYLEAARQWALASCGYKTWGLGRTDGMDLAAGHQLFGLALVYDWCHAELDPVARRTIRDTLARRTSAIFEAAATGRAWWHRSYLQNHLWVNITGMAAAGLVLFDEVDDAVLWIGLPLAKYRHTMAALGQDGASHEGVGYWEYGVEYMMKFMDPARQYLDTDWFDLDWWRQTPLYSLYLSLPRQAWTRGNCIVDIADCPRGHWYGPDYLLRGLARHHRDGVAQWLADQVDQANVPSPGAPWLNLIWFDPTLQATPPTTLPTLRHFDDMDIVSARSDWSGNESLVVFKCGPFIGHKAVQEFSYDPGGGHVHPDANHFVIFGAGEWLIRDDGYRAKWTGQHNTLLVDGQGQIGEGKMWFDGSQALRLKARPRILRAESKPAFDHIVGDAAAAYPAELGLRRYVRHALFFKPDVLLVLDDIELGTPRELALRFHPEQTRPERDGAAFRFTGRQAVLRLDPLTLDGAAVEARDFAAAGRHGEKGESLFAVQLSRKAARWRNAVAFSWTTQGQTVPVVALSTEADVWRFQVGQRRLTFDWASGQAQTP